MHIVSKRNHHARGTGCIARGTRECRSARCSGQVAIDRHACVKHVLMHRTFVTRTLAHLLRKTRKGLRDEEIGLASGALHNSAFVVVMDALRASILPGLSKIRVVHFARAVRN